MTLILIFHPQARLNVDEEIFLVNPHGLLYNEITASSLVKVDMRGDVIESGNICSGGSGLNSKCPRNFAFMYFLPKFRGSSARQAPFKIRISTAALRGSRKNFPARIKQ